MVEQSWTGVLSNSSRSVNLWALVKFNLGGLFCYSCQSIVIAVFEKAGWYSMQGFGLFFIENFEKTSFRQNLWFIWFEKTSEKAIKRHVESKRHKKATASYTVKITGPDFTIKTERNAKSSWNKWNISSTKFENSLCQNSL